jgi:alpha-L-glutamate ligase-like protein
MWVSSLRRRGVLGMNRRNYDFVGRWNPRRLYPLVDDKLRTKRLCEEFGVPTPALIGSVHHHYELRGLAGLLEDRDSFVVKPASGAQGNGILVLTGRQGDDFVRSNGRLLSRGDLEFHVAEVLSGLYSLGGQPDHCLIEERLTVHPRLAEVSSGGVPDVRLIVYRGFPALGMVRLPTQRSAGRANLHQGAIGAGIDWATGHTHHAVMRSRPVTEHPDTGKAVIGVELPAFEELLEVGIRIADAAGLGYLGVDLVIDEERGPVVLELNARPGLAIQLANNCGLLPRLEAIDRCFHPSVPVAERVAFARGHAA